MAITVDEMLNSREIVVGESVIRRYVCRGSSNDLDIADAVLAQTPTNHGYYPRKNNPRIVPAKDADMQTAETAIWIADVTYQLEAPDKDEQPEDPDDGLGLRFSFDTSGGTRHITEGFALIDAQPNDAEDFGLAINVTGDDTNLQVEGADVVTGNGQFQISKVVEAMNFAKFKAWKALTGKTNNAAFQGFAAGEVLFLGASGTGRVGSGIDVTFTFVADSSDPALPVAGEVVEYEGHANVWVKYAPTVGELGIKPDVKGVYVVRQYQQADFSILPI